MSLSSCITTHGVKTHNRLPADIKAAVAAGDTKLAISLMESHVANLKSLKQGVTEQHKINKQEFMAQTISATSAASYVNRAATDPTNELNLFKVKSFSKIWKNIVQRTGNVTNAIKQVLATEDSVTLGEQAVLQHFNGPDGFNRKMGLVINRIFKAKNDKAFQFRYEDMIQYLPVRVASEFEKANLKLDEQHTKDHGVLDAATRSAIAASAYEWLATNGRKSMRQTEQSLGRLLGLSKDESLPANSFDLLGETGVDAETLARQLGKTILQRMSIAAGPKADSLAQTRMEESLGFMAIAAMEEMGIFERQFVIADRTQEAKDSMTAAQIKASPMGLEALKDGHYLKPNQVFYKDDGSPTGQKGLLTLRLVKLVDVDTLTEIEDKFKLGREAFDKIFANEPQEFGMRWAAKKIESFTIGRSKITANAVQTANINKYNSIPYQRNPEAINFLKSMWQLVVDQKEEEQDTVKSLFFEMLGAPSSENLLDLHHRNNEGIRRGIEQDFNDVLNYEIAHEQRVAEGKSTEFFLSSDFMANMRMIMRGDINPQNSKMHRSLFAPTGFQTTFKKSAKGKLDQALLEAVAVAFDIETGKGLIGNGKAQVAKLLAAINNPDDSSIRTAITAIQEFNANGKMTGAMLQDIANGSSSIGNKVTGLKGLFEYARYEATKAGQDFTTDLHAEIDGVSNGVIIGILQLIPDSAEKRDVLATLAMGGISTNAAKTNLNKLLIQNNLNDAYQRMAQEWALEIAELKKSWHQSTDSDNQDKFEKARALGEILGQFQDKEGVINKTIRGLSKPRTMQIIYGAGIKKQVQLLTGDSVLHDGIYKQVEKVIAKVRAGDPTGKADFTQLMVNVSILTDSTAFTAERYFTGKSKAETIANLQKFQLNREHLKELNKSVADTYGKAMENAIAKVYGALIEARKPLNTAVQLAVTTYNTILKKKVDMLVEQHKANTEFKGDPEVVTNEELDTILASIEHLIPKVKTPLHTKDSPSFLPMAEVGKNRAYNKQAEVRQNYNSEKLPLHKGFAEGIPYLEDPGVAPIIKTIHMLDSMVANGLMGLDTHMLNNHDGFSHGIGDSAEIATAANTIFAKVMTEYSLGQAFQEMHADLVTEGQKVMEELGVQPEDFFYGTRRANDDTSLFSGGLINDNVITLDLLVRSGVVADHDARAKFISDEQEDGVSYKTAARNYINTTLSEFLTNTGMDLGEFTKTYILDQISHDVKIVSEETTKNKKEVTDSVYQWMQYPHHGEGIRVDAPANTDGKVFNGINTNTILTHDKKATDSNIRTLKALVEAGYGSTDSDVSTNPADYDNPSQQIDNKNVSEVFESIVTMDSNMAHATVQDSPGHIDYLKGILDGIVSKVMGPVELFINDHKINNETQGMYTIGSQGKRIWIQTQQRSDHPVAGMLGQGVRMSAAEVYVHELVHHITHAGLKNFPILQRQAAALRELAFTEFTAKYGVDAFRVFLNNPNLDITDVANKFEVDAAKSRWEYVFNTKSKANGQNAGVDEFISFGMTNENFKRELGTLNLSPEMIQSRKSLSTVFEKNLQQTIINLFSMVTDFLYKQFNHQRHSTKVDQELENLVRAISYVDSKNKSVLWQSIMTVDGTLTAMGLKIDEKVVGTIKAAIDKTKVGQAITILKKMPELDNMLSHQVRVMLHWYTSQQQGLIPALISEMKGDTLRLRPLHDMLRMRKHVIDVAKNEAGAVMRAVNNEWFKHPLKPHEKSAITKALLKTDVSSLVGKSLPREIIGYLTSSTLREARIAKLVQQIRLDPALQAYEHFFLNAADDLGYFMVTSSAKNRESVPFMNAHNIVAMKQTKHNGKITGEAFDRAINLVDELVTLSSLQYVSNANKNAAATVMREDWSAVENVLNHHNVLKADAYKDLFNNNPALMTKGYVKQILNSRLKFEQGTLADRQAFEDAGYFMQRDPIPRDPNDPVQEDIYMFKSSLGAVNDLQPGIASYSQNVARGATSYDIQQQVGNDIDAPRIAANNNNIVLTALLTKIDKMFLPRNPANSDPSGNHMIPKFNDKGDIVEMRYMMSEHTKDSILEQFSEFDAVLAGMTSQLVDKVATPGINQELIIALKDMADSERKKYPEAYVEISPWSTEKRYRDIYHQLPPKARAQIMSVWGENRMWVAQDVIDLAFGQRKYSISETFAKDKRTRNLFENMMVGFLNLALGGNNPLTDPPVGALPNDSAQGNAVRRSTAIFNTMAQLTKLGKSNIVVRNLSVVLGNHESNMMYLKSLGVPLEKIILLNKEATLGILQYQKDKYELESWRHKRGIIARKQSITQAERDIQLTNVDRKIADLANKVAINKVTPMVDAGTMPSIVDDFETDPVQSPYRYGVDALLDKGLEILPTGMQRAGRALFMTTDTEGFKMLNNAVKLTDFTGRYILYHHLVSQGVDKEAAISEVMDKFLNFDLPTHRMISMLNDVGLLLFTKYTLRVLKHIKNAVIEHPFSTLATYLVSSNLLGGDNIMNSIPFLTKRADQVLNDPITLFATSPFDILTVDGIQVVGGVLGDMINPTP